MYAQRATASQRTARDSSPRRRSRQARRQVLAIGGMPKSRMQSGEQREYSMVRRCTTPQPNAPQRNARVQHRVLHINRHTPYRALHRNRHEQQRASRRRCRCSFTRRSASTSGRCACRGRRSRGCRGRAAGCASRWRSTRSSTSPTLGQTTTGGSPQPNPTPTAHRAWPVVWRFDLAPVRLIRLCWRLCVCCRVSRLGARTRWE